MAFQRRKPKGRQAVNLSSDREKGAGEERVLSFEQGQQKEIYLLQRGNIAFRENSKNAPSIGVLTGHQEKDRGRKGELDFELEIRKEWRLSSEELRATAWMEQLLECLSISCH